MPSVAAQLAQELGISTAELFQRLTSVEGEELVPTYLTTNPDGTVSASFTGQVHAQGLTLDADTGGQLVNHKVRWVRQSDGAEVAYVLGQTSGGLEQTFVVAEETTGTDTAEVTLQPKTKNNHSALVNVRANESGSGLYSVDIQIPGFIRYILSSDGGGVNPPQSGFLQLASGGNAPGGLVALRLSMGSFTPGAPPTINWQYGAWTVARNAVGDYTISGFPANPLIPAPVQPWIAFTNADPAAPVASFAITALGATSVRFTTKVGGVNTDIATILFAAIN